MLSVIVNWIYILLTGGILGAAVLALAARFCDFRFRHADTLFFAGMVSVTVYAQCISLVAKVGLTANFILIGICFLLIRQAGRQIYEVISFMKRGIGKKELITFFLVFFLFAYGTSTGLIHYDSNLYHAQAIRWIEEYGSVPGLGNLQTRLAYNSSSFCLSALYSMSFLLGQSLHTAAGLFACVCCTVSLGFLKAIKRKRLLLSDFARLGMFYYTTIIYKEMNSPASDYFTMLTIFYIVVRWLVLLEEKEEAVAPYALLCVLGVYAVTLKLSAGVILLLVIKPAASLLKGKRWGEISFYLGLGLFVLAPFLARNVILSGWIIYPFTFLDLFSPDWKIPQLVAEYDAKEIQVWGRGIYDVAQYHIPITKWLPGWFHQELTQTEKLIVLGSLASVPCLLVQTVLWIKRKEYDRMLVVYTIAVCFLIWLFSAPMMRYGYAYPLLLPLLVFGGWIVDFVSDRIGRLLAFGMLAFFLVRLVQFSQEVYFSLQKYGISVMQVDYDTFEAEEEKLSGITFYVPMEDDRIGYRYFPSAPRLDHVELRGEHLKDGFRYR